MIAVVSHSKVFQEHCAELLYSLGILPLLCDYQSYPEKIQSYHVGAVILHSDSDNTAAAEASSFLLSINPEIRILAAVKRSPDSPSLYMDIPGSCRQVLLPCDDAIFLTAIKRFYGIALHRYHLSLGEKEQNAVLLGYEMKLTSTEYFILRLLVCISPGVLPAENICQFVRNISRNCLSVHISSINKKAARISGRRIIVCNNGYGLNKFM